MMNKFKNKICLILAPILLIGMSYSCSDKFYTEPAGSNITPEQHFNSWIDLETAVYGTMIPIQKVMPNIILVDGLRSDMMDVKGNASLLMRELNDQIINKSNPYLDGSYFYKVVVQVNEILKNLDRIKLKEPEFDKYMSFTYKGNLIGLRSWAYLYIIRLYGEAIGRAHV